MSDLGEKSANSPRPVAEELPKQMGLVTSWVCVKPDAERVVVRAPAVSPCQRSSPRQQGLCQNPAICIILHLIVTLSSIRNILIAFLTKPPRLGTLAPEEAAVPRQFGGTLESTGFFIFFASSEFLTRWMSLKSRSVSCRLSLGSTAGEGTRLCTGSQEASRPTKGYNHAAACSGLTTAF